MITEIEPAAPAMVPASVTIGEPVDSSEGAATVLKASTRALLEQRRIAMSAVPDEPPPIEVAPVVPPVVAPVEVLPPTEEPLLVTKPIEPPPVVEDPRDKQIAAFHDRREQFHEDPVRAVRAQLADWLGVAHDSPELQRHLVDLVTDISGDIAGVGVKLVSAERVERRLSRKLESYKQQSAAAEEKRTREATEAQRVQTRASTVSYLDAQLRSANAAYPALAALDAPGAAILDRIEAAHARGEKLEWSKAAADAEAEITKFLTRFQPLYASQQQATPAKPTLESKPSSPPSSHRAPALSNTDASQVAPTPREPPATLEEAEQRSIARLRAARRQ